MRVLEDSAALPNSPQGDGNLCFSDFICSVNVLHYQIPRKGTETPLLPTLREL
jgi:hypothetical protein